MSKHIAWGEKFGEGEIVCACDGCGDVETIDFYDNDVDFKEAQSYIKSLGWRSMQVNGEWQDFCCEDCRNKFIRDNT